jgi:hypothetical protein
MRFRKPRIAFSVACAVACVLICGCNSTAQKQSKPLPRNVADNRTNEIVKLSATIQGKSPTEIREIIRTHVGDESRHVGSGVDIEEWDVEGGVLTYHPATGVYYHKDGVRKRLLQTSNRVGECLFGSYEMTTAPPKKGDTRYWIGNLRLESRGAYQFTDSGQFPDQRSGQESNFFLKHPSGMMHIVYSKGITTESVLEQLPNNARLAEIVFTAADGSVSAKYYIKSDGELTCLLFESDSQLPFQMHKSWEYYWNYAK